MKKSTLLMGALMLHQLAICQVNIDKAIQLTGSGADAKISGIQDVSGATDAASAGVVQNGTLVYSASGGSANALTVALNPPPSAYLAGMMLHIKATQANTGAVTIDVNGLGAIPIKKSVNTDLAANDIALGQMFSIIYDGTNFQMVSGSGSSSGPQCITSYSPNPPSGYAYSGYYQQFSQDPAVSFWTTKATIPIRKNASASAVYNNKIYLFGGWGTGNSTDYYKSYCYDVATNSWSSIADLPGSANTGNFEAALVNNKIYIIGGETSPGQSCSPGVTLEYDPVANTYTSKASTGHRRKFAIGVINSIIYVAGGESNCCGGCVRSDMQSYNPATDTWATKASMSVARNGLTGAAVGGKFYAIGGYQTDSPSGDSFKNEMYDPITNTWTTKTPLPTARQNMSCTVVNGLIYVIGGQTTITKNEAYDPATNTWSVKSAFPNANSWACTYSACESVNNKIYLIGGGNECCTGYTHTYEYNPSSDVGSTQYLHCQP